MEKPYYFTWTKQKEALTLPLDKVEDHYFCYKNKKWINLSSISYQSHFGLQNKAITKAIQKQIEVIPMASPKHIFDLKEKVSQKLLSKLPFSNFKVFYTLSGSEGIENALKMARQVSQRKLVASLENSYHGATMGSLSVTGDWRNKDHIHPRQWSLKIPMPYEDPEGIKLQETIEAYGPKKIAAFCLETVTGGNGVFIHPKAWLKKLNWLCKKYGIFLILDEVVCGAHRTGPFFGLEHFPFLKPDFIVLAKGITGGYFPMGCVLTNKRISQYYQDNTLSCGLTNYAHPIGLAALQAVLKITELKSFHINRKKNEDYLKEWTKNLNNKAGITTRCIGSLAAIEGHNITQQELYDHGIYAPIQSGRIILAPPLTMKINTLKNGLKMVEKIL